MRVSIGASQRLVLESETSVLLRPVAPRALGPRIYTEFGFTRPSRWSSRELVIGDATGGLVLAELGGLTKCWGVALMAGRRGDWLCDQAGWRLMRGGRVLCFEVARAHGASWTEGGR